MSVSVVAVGRVVWNLECACPVKVGFLYQQYVYVVLFQVCDYFAFLVSQTVRIESRDYQSTVFLSYHLEKVCEGIK